MTCSRAVRIYAAVSCPRCDLIDNKLNTSFSSQENPPHRELIKTISNVLIYDNACSSDCDEIRRLRYFSKYRWPTLSKVNFLQSYSQFICTLRYNFYLKNIREMDVILCYKQNWDKIWGFDARRSTWIFYLS